MKGKLFKVTGISNMSPNSQICQFSYSIDQSKFVNQQIYVPAKPNLAKESALPSPQRTKSDQLDATQTSHRNLNFTDKYLSP